MIQTRAVNATVARAVIDPDFLQAAGRDLTRALSDMGLPPGTSLHYAKLSRLAAFVCKVQHNDLWEVLPQTLRMIRAQGRELEVFEAYHPHRLKFGTSQRQRSESFANFLAGYMKDNKRQFPAGYDLVRHEWTFRQLSNGWHGPIVEGDLDGARSSEGWRPRLHGLVIIHAYERDPLILERSCDFAADDSLATSSGKDVFLCYFKDSVGSAAPCVFRVDPLTALVFSCVDGARTPLDIAERVGCGRNMESVVEVLTSAIKRGLVSSPPSRFGGREG